MHAWAKELKEKTKAGAMLFIEGELWLNPKWKITKNKISVTSGNLTQMLLEHGDDPTETEAEWRKRLRVLVEA